MLNSVVFFDESYGGERSAGFKALRRIVKRALYGQVPDDLGGDLAKVLGDVDEIASALYGRATGDARYRTLDTLLLCRAGAQPGQPPHAGRPARPQRPA